MVVLHTLTEEEWENLVVSTHPGFVRLMRRSYARFKPGAGIPLEEVEREFAFKATPARTRRRGRRSKVK